MRFRGKRLVLSVFPTVSPDEVTFEQTNLPLEALKMAIFSLQAHCGNTERKAKCLSGASIRNGSVCCVVLPCTISGTRALTSNKGKFCCLVTKWRPQTELVESLCLLERTTENIRCVITCYHEYSKSFEPHQYNL